MARQLSCAAALILCLVSNAPVAAMRRVIVTRRALAGAVAAASATGLMHAPYLHLSPASARFSQQALSAASSAGISVSIPSRPDPQAVVTQESGQAVAVPTEPVGGVEASLKEVLAEEVAEKEEMLGRQLSKKEVDKIKSRLKLYGYK
eukprot:scaffold45192_cov43-Tisochrysis_lutea.AAC.2